MPSKKKKYNARFPAGRIKKIMQSDEEVGKVAQAVPIIISRTLELFVESLLQKTLRITNARNAKTLSTSHMKQCIMSESRFDFLRELVKNVPDINIAEEQALSDVCLTTDSPTLSLSSLSNIAAAKSSTSGCAKTSTITSPNGNYGYAASSSSSSSSSNNNNSSSSCISNNISGIIPTISHRSNGNKRNQTSFMQTTAATTDQQYISSSLCSNISDLSELHSNVRAPGFYKDHYTDSSPDKTASVIHYTPKIQTQKSTLSHYAMDLMDRPPKLKRMESAPAGSHMYFNKSYSTTIATSSSPSPLRIPSSPTLIPTNTSSLSMKNNRMSHTTIRLNDFTTTGGSVSVATTTTTTTTNKLKNVPPLTPLKVTSLSSIATAQPPSLITASSNISSGTRQSIGGGPSFVYPTTSKDNISHEMIRAIDATSPIIKIDVSNTITPMLKIDYSNLSMPLKTSQNQHSTQSYQISSMPSCSSLSSTSIGTPMSGSSTSLATTKSAAMINIDMLNSYSTKPSYKTYNPIASTSTSTCLEMDEDYDNI